MRVLVFFDLPVSTASERRDYARFRKHLIKSGFLMMQESVYSKICLNYSAVSALTDQLKKNKPPQGLVQVLSITEQQYARMEFIVGSVQRDLLDTDNRTVIL